MQFQHKKLRVPDFRSVTNYAIWLLSRREYAAAELLQKFHRRFVIAEKLFVEVLQKLQAQNLQSDERAARVLIESHPGWGVARLKLELRRRGVAEDIFSPLLTDSVDERERVLDVLALKLHGAAIPQDFKERQKLLAFLVRRGFSLDVAKKVLG